MSNKIVKIDGVDCNHPESVFYLADAIAPHLEGFDLERYLFRSIPATEAKLKQIVETGSDRSHVDRVRAGWDNLRANPGRDFKTAWDLIDPDKLFLARYDSSSSDPLAELVGYGNPFGKLDGDFSILTVYDADAFVLDDGQEDYYEFKDARNRGESVVRVFRFPLLTSGE